MLSKSIKRRYQFFRSTTGIVGQDALAALNLARAEERLQRRIDRGTARILWVPDEHADLSWMDADDLEKLESGYWGVRGCILETKCRRCGEWKHVASLWGIVSAFDASDTY